jgi:hypothetical protein
LTMTRDRPLREKGPIATVALVSMDRLFRKFGAEGIRAAAKRVTAADRSWHAHI